MDEPQCYSSINRHTARYLSVRLFFCFILKRGFRAKKKKGYYMKVKELKELVNYIKNDNEIEKFDYLNNNYNVLIKEWLEVGSYIV